MNLFKKGIVAHLLALVVLLTGGSAVAQRSPEETQSGMRCRVDSECPQPYPDDDQSIACLAPRCKAGVCGAQILVGKQLNRYQNIGVRCYKAPVVCDASGREAPSQNPNTYIADREGEPCEADPPVANESQQALSIPPFLKHSSCNQQ